MSQRLALSNGVLLAFAATLYFADLSLTVIPFLHALSALLLANFLRDKSLVGKLAAVGTVLWAVAQVWRGRDSQIQLPVSILILGAAFFVLISFSILQDRRMSQRTRLARTIDGFLLAIVVVGLQWFFFIDGARDLGSLTVLVEFLVFVPFVSSLLFVMYSQRSSLLLANVGTFATGLFAAMWFDSIAIDTTFSLGWDLVAMIGVTAFSLATAASKQDRNPSALLPLLPYALGILVMVMGVVHAIFGPAGAIDVVVMAVVGVVLIVRQGYSYIEQRRLLAAVSQHETQMRHLALHDVLTSLPNRALFQDRLEHAVALRQRNGGDLSLIYVDVDEFKKINDTYGHVLGDELLIHVARRLATWVRPTDTVARLGGDEFVILMESNTDGAKRVAQRLESELSHPYDIGGRVIRASASIGISTLSEWTGEITDLGEKLVNSADRAMYQAKSDRSGIAIN